MYDRLHYDRLTIYHNEDTYIWRLLTLIWTIEFQVETKYQEVQMCDSAK